MQEIWKGVKGFEEYVEISNFGNLRRIKERKNVFNNGVKEYEINRPIKATYDRGYLKVNLSVNGKRHLRYIHRMVAEAFIPNPNNYKEVNHIDHDPSNNCVSNLEWCDRKYNIDYMIKHQKEIKERHERRTEALEMIWFLATQDKFVKSEAIFNLIPEDLMGDY